MEGLRREDHRGRPAVGGGVDHRRQLGAVLTHDPGQERSDLIDAEREGLIVDLEELALTAQPIDREGGRPASGEHDVQVGRRQPDERLDELDRRRCVGDLVKVVEDHHGVLTRVLGQDIGDHRGAGPGALDLVGVVLVALTVQEQRREGL
jgi:hypothetical protein